uniref:Meta-cleavage enzyme n=1 Tax=Metapseudomonas resinovorans TaxID=53412 RepID=C5NS28_METRE|nr:meta-cleavage enzyme [Pseudomonas resinovorans]
MMVDAGAHERLYLKMDERPYRILVERADRDGYGACGWEVAGKAAFEQAIAELQQADVEVRRGSASDAASRKVQELALFADPDGNRHELFWGPLQDFAPFISPAGVSGFVTSALGMGHAVLPAPSFDRCLDFYQRVMGFGLSDLMKVRFTPDPAEPEKRIHFLHCNNARHHFPGVVRMPDPLRLRAPDGGSARAGRRRPRPGPHDGPRREALRHPRPPHQRRHDQLLHADPRRLRPGVRLRRQGHGLGGPHPLRKHGGQPLGP